MASEKRLIDANELVDVIEDIDWYHINKRGKLCHGANPANNTPIYKALDIYNAIKNAPTVDAVEVVYGQWQKLRTHDWLCSVCKVGVPYSYTGHHYCPNCGARMDGERKKHA